MAPKPKPRPELDETPPDDTRSLRVEGPSPSPLHAYLKANSLSLRSFTRAMGVDPHHVQRWYDGIACPSLPAALEIERITKGVIAAEMWMALPCAKRVLTRFRSRQPAPIRGPTFIDPAQVPPESARAQPATKPELTDELAEDDPRDED